MNTKQYCFEPYMLPYMSKKFKTFWLEASINSILGIFGTISYYFIWYFCQFLRKHSFGVLTKKKSTSKNKSLLREQWKFKPFVRAYGNYWAIATDKAALSSTIGKILIDSFGQSLKDPVIIPL